MHRQIISSTLIYFAMIMLQALLQVVLLPLQTQYLSPGQYGTLATVIAIAIILSPLFNLGLQGAAQRFMVDFSEDCPERKKMWSTLLFLSLFVGIGMGLVTLIILFFLPSEIGIASLGISTLSIAIVHAIAMGAVLVGSDLLRMIHQPKRYALSMIIMSLLYLTMNIVFIGIFQWKLAGALVAFALMPWLGFVTMVVTNRDTIVKIGNRKYCLELLKYSIKTLPHFTFTTLNSVADRVLLAIILGVQLTGVYTAGTTIASVMLMMTSAIGYSARPQIFSRFAENSAVSLKEVRSLTLSSVLIIGLAGANLVLWSPEILSLLTASSYHNAWQVTSILTLKYMLQGLSIFILSGIFFNKKKTHQLVWIAISSFLILLAISIKLAPEAGILGVAIAGLITTAFELFCNFYCAKRSFKMQWPIAKMLGILCAFFIPACVLLIYAALINSIFYLISIKFLFSLCTILASLFMLSRQYKLKIPALLSIVFSRDALES